MSFWCLDMSGSDGCFRGLAPGVGKPQQAVGESGRVGKSRQATFADQAAPLGDVGIAAEHADEADDRLRRPQ